MTVRVIFPSFSTCELLDIFIFFWQDLKEREERLDQVEEEKRILVKTMSQLQAS